MRYAGAVSSLGKLFGRSTVYGRAGEHKTPYMTRLWVGRLRLHIFHRGDADPDCHDHPWDFWTFPFTSYVEEVVSPELAEGLQNTDRVGSGWNDALARRLRVVPAWRLSRRPATHCHRVVGPYSGVVRDPLGEHIRVNARVAESLASEFDWAALDGGQAFRPMAGSGRIVTLVWRSGAERKWGFLKSRDGRWCWSPWKEYVFGGGKDAPCSDD